MDISYTWSYYVLYSFFDINKNIKKVRIIRYVKNEYNTYTIILLLLEHRLCAIFIFTIPWKYKKN